MGHANPGKQNLHRALATKTMAFVLALLLSVPFAGVSGQKGDPAKGSSKSGNSNSQKQQDDAAKRPDRTGTRIDPDKLGDVGSMTSPRDAASGIDPRVIDLAKRGATRQFFVYTFRRAGRRTQLEFRPWNGLFTMRKLFAGRPAVFQLRDRRGRAVVLGRQRLLSKWYKQRDGSISKRLLNGRNQPIGQLTLDSSGNKTLALDLDADDQVEFLAVLDRSRRLQIFAEDAQGLSFYRDILNGTASLCDVRSSAAPVTSDPRLNLTCQRRSIGGAGGRSIGGERRDKGDVLTATCAGLTKGPDSSIPTYADDPEIGVIDVIFWGGLGIAAPAVALFLAIVTYAAPAGESAGSIPIQDVPDGEDVIMLEDVDVTAGEDEPTNSVYIEDEIVIEAGSDSERSGGTTSRDRPVDPSKEGLNALTQICRARQDLQTKWRYLDVREATNCSNPYRMPVPGPTDQNMGRLTCTDGNEPFLDPERDIRSAGANCGPFARPGPDGKCSGRGMFFGSSRGSGGAYVMAGSGIIGVQPCDPRFCNPPPQR